jgi:hypothetical protein
MTTGSISSTHVIHTGETLDQNVEGHPARKDSPEFVSARTTLHKLLPRLFGGHNPWEIKSGDVGVGVQAHHGGSILVYSKVDDVWRIVLNIFGIEWCEQFSTDPAKLDLARQNAEAIIAAFPDTEPELQALGYTDVALLHHKIETADDIAKYVDSIFNACVPIPQPQHTGSVAAKTPEAAGVHNYPLPACNIPMFCVSTFDPFVVDAPSKTVAVVQPVSPIGSGDGRLRVEHAPPGHPLYEAHHKAEKSGNALIISADHPIALHAFRHQR